MEYCIDMNRPVVLSPERRLSYQFMAAEALWIVSGDNQLAPLVRFAPHYARFSDDGRTLRGAYGPPFHTQLEYVIQALTLDRDTRQASLSIWRPNPEPSKDIPCTMAMNFSIRNDKLNSHVFMRSSDAWLGLPYDTFSFTLMAVMVACFYNKWLTSACGPRVGLGKLTITAASSHLYAKDIGKAKAVLESICLKQSPQVFSPTDIEDGNWAAVERSITSVRENEPNAPWGRRVE
jgi:hypothetical protein